MSDRGIFLLTITNQDLLLEVLIIDSPNLEAALIYATEEASNYFSTDKGWSPDKTEHWRISWELIGGDFSEYRVHLSRADILRLNEEGEEVEDE